MSPLEDTSCISRHVFIVFFFLVFTRVTASLCILYRDLNVTTQPLSSHMIRQLILQYKEQEGNSKPKTDTLSRQPLHQQNSGSDKDVDSLD